MIISGKTNNFSLGILVLLFFIYLFVIYNANFSGPDEPIYLAYTASIVDDGDLNAVNNLDAHYPYYLASGKIGISETYNLPDYHNHGGIVLWAPFYTYAKFIYQISDKLSLTSLVKHGYDRIVKCSMSFSTVVFAFFTLLLTYKLCRVFFSRYLSIWSVLMVFIGTPFFYYTIQETANANIIACLFSTVSIWACIYAINMKKTDWFLFGLFFSICTVVKIDLWFQAFFILGLFVALLRLKQIQLKSGIYFLLGFMPVTILRIINDYIKYGTFQIGELGLLNLRDNYLLEQLFSSYRGFFYTSPIFYFCLLGFVFISVNLLKGLGKNKVRDNLDEFKMNDIFFIILAGYLFIKIALLSYRYAWGGGTCGARQLLTEFPVFVLLYARALQNQRKYILYLFGAVSILFISWNLLIISEYISKVDLHYVAQVPKLMKRIFAAKNILIPLFHTKDLGIKLRLCFPLLIVFFILTSWIMKIWKTPVSASFWHTKSEDRRSFYKIFSLCTIYLCATYIFFTIFNLANNRINVEKLKAQGFFMNSQILSPREFSKEENLGSMKEMIEYFELKGDINKIKKIKQYKESMLNDRFKPE